MNFADAESMSFLYSFRVPKLVRDSILVCNSTTRKSEASAKQRRNLKCDLRHPACPVEKAFRAPAQSTTQLLGIMLLTLNKPGKIVEMLSTLLDDDIFAGFHLRIFNKIERRAYTGKGAPASPSP